LDSYFHSSNRKTIIESFFIKPKLKIIYDPDDRTAEHISETDDGRWGSLLETRGFVLPDGTTLLPPWDFLPKRCFINIIVQNNGRGLAENCGVRLKLLHKTVGCQWLSFNEKSLAWNDGNIGRTIGARGNKATFHLAFSQQLLTTDQQNDIIPSYCNIAKKKVKVNSWIGTREALKKPESRDQDGLCQGEFTVHIEVFTDYGHRAYKHFVITVGDDWHSLNVTMIDCQCFRKFKFC
jgi:hypothetical protein